MDKSMQIPTDLDRNTVIKALKHNLEARSGKKWSVTGGRGTAYGWITIDAPPARRTWHHREVAGGAIPIYEDYNDPSHQYEGHAGPEDRAELAKLLGIETVHSQGVSIASSNEYYREYLQRSAGQTPSKIAQPYWD